MDKLTREQEVIVRKLPHYSKSEEFPQFILITLSFFRLFYIPL